MAIRTPDRFVKDTGNGSGTPEHVIIDGQPVDVNVTGGNVTLDATDIEIGAVEIKDGNSDNRAEVSAAGAVLVDLNNSVALDAATLTALENITVTGEVSLDAATLAALETINVVAIDYRYGGGKLSLSDTLNSAGDTDLITPSLGMRVRVFWIAFVPSTDNTASNLLSFGFGTTGGSITTELYRGYAMAHWEVFTGAVNESLIVNAATSEPVAITVHYQEVA